MGAIPWAYFVPYEEDIELALEKLKNREFAAGRFYPAMTQHQVLIEETAPGAVSSYKTIEEAIEAAGETGTRSILDMWGVSDGSEIVTVSPIDEETLMDLYDTTEPTKEMLSDLQILDQLDRLRGSYSIAYEQGVPTQILFVGYSAD